MCASCRDAAADIADARLQATALATQASSNLAAKDKKFAEDILVSEARFGFGADMGPLLLLWGVLGSVVFVEFFFVFAGACENNSGRHTVRQWWFGVAGV